MPAILRHNWWALAIRGIAGIVFGIFAFVAPGMTFAVLVIWFGAYALVDGIFSLIAAWRGPDGGARWGSLLLEGIAGIVGGIVAFVWPVATGAALVLIVAAWAVITGAFEIAAAIRLRRTITGEWALITMGVLSILFGFLLFMRPIVGALAITMWMGAYAFVFGVLMLILAFRMRHWLRTRVTGQAYGPA